MFQEAALGRIIPKFWGERVLAGAGAALDADKAVVDGVEDKLQPTKKRKDPHAVALGRKGGLKSWAGRKAKLSPERRSEIAKNAVNARWRKYREQQAKQKRKPR